MFAPPSINASISSSEKVGRPYEGGIVVTITVVPLESEGVGGVATTAGDPLGDWPLITAAHPALPKKRIDGTRCGAEDVDDTDETFVLSTDKSDLVSVDAAAEAVEDAIAPDDSDDDACTVASASLSIS